MLTCKATAPNTEMKLRQALLELKKSKDTCNKLLSERDESEEEIKNIFSRNSQLKAELSQLHLQYEEVVCQKSQLEVTISKCDEQMNTYEESLNQITKLEQELHDANCQISLLLEQQKHHETEKAISLYEELVEV